jgi:hypothetical protein
MNSVLRQAIEDVIDNADDDGCSDDLIVTSKRAVEALAQAIKPPDGVIPLERLPIRKEEICKIHKDNKVSFMMKTRFSSFDDIGDLNDRADMAFLGDDSEYTLDNLSYEPKEIIEDDREGACILILAHADVGSILYDMELESKMEEGSL